MPISYILSDVLTSYVPYENYFCGRSVIQKYRKMYEIYSMIKDTTNEDSKEMYMLARLRMTAHGSNPAVLDTHFTLIFDRKYKISRGGITVKYNGEDILFEEQCAALINDVRNKMAAEIVSKKFSLSPALMLFNHYFSAAQFSNAPYEFKDGTVLNNIIEENTYSGELIARLFRGLPISLV